MLEFQYIERELLLLKISWVIVLTRANNVYSSVYLDNSDNLTNRFKYRQTDLPS